MSKLRSSKSSDGGVVVRRAIRTLCRRSMGARDLAGNDGPYVRLCDVKPYPGRTKTSGEPGNKEHMFEDVAALRAEAEERLRALAGEHATLREDQWTAIHALVVERRRVLVVQRTGWGKSAVYFVATGLLRDLGEGPTVIVSPLL